MIAYRFLKPAERELLEASLFYETASVGLGTQFLDDIERILNRVRAHPHVGNVVAGNLRRSLLHRFPFSIIYSVEANEILVIAVAHFGRRPGYWENRIDQI